MSAELELHRSREKVAALLAPRNVVIVGASDRPGSWATRLKNNLERHEFQGAVYPINPTRAEVWGQPCFADFGSLPEAPDHLAVLVPAPAVCEALRTGAAMGARSATIFTSGFGEGHDSSGREIGRELADVVRATGLGVSGPNCFGNVSVASKLVTFMEDRQLPLRPGPVALVGQSGGVLMFTNRVLEERGLFASYVITSGNEIGLSISDYLAYFAADAAVRVIVCYVEAVRDVEKFIAACHALQQAQKHVIMIKLGQSEEGKAAALAHTGALAGTTEAFDAVTGAFGVIRVDTLDEAVEVAEFLVHSEVPNGGRLAAITLSGAYRGMLLDAAARQGLIFPQLSSSTLAELTDILTVGASVGNPLDGGFAIVSSEKNYLACIEAMDRDPNTDILILQQELPRQAGTPRAEKYIQLVEEYARTRARKPIACVSMLTHSHTDYSRAIREASPSVPFLQEANKAIYTIRKAVRSRELQRLSIDTVTHDVRPSADVQSLTSRASVAGGTTLLNEVESKVLLSGYGLRAPREIVAATPDEAALAADEIGFPVVLKGIATNLAHKSDAGAVRVGINSTQDLRQSWVQIEENVRRKIGNGGLEGMLVCEQVNGGVEIVLGVHRDPEMGPVVMVGSGGILLELVNDVAFGSPPISREKAADMLSQTRVHRLLSGYRGGRACDTDAVIDALVALGRAAKELGSVIDSIDINPFVVLEAGRGGFMLDALVVLHKP